MFPKPDRHLVKKFQKFLSPGEELAYVAHIGDRYFWSITIGCIGIYLILISMLPLSTRFNLLPLWLAILLALLSLITVIPLMKVLHLRHSLTYLFTNRRIIIKRGIFSLSITTAPYDKITHIQVEQKFLDRICYDTGTIAVHTAGPTPIEMELVYIEKPIAIKNMLDELIHQEKTVATQPVSQPWPQAVTNDVVTLQ